VSSGFFCCLSDSKSIFPLAFLGNIPCFMGTDLYPGLRPGKFFYFSNLWQMSKSFPPFTLGIFYNIRLVNILFLIPIASKQSEFAFQALIKSAPKR
jgi:hypothetical protein